MKAIIISDVHYEKNRDSYNGRDDGLANILLLRAVHRINSYIKPDIVCLLGDFVNNGELEYLEEIYDIIKLLECPYIVLPGNHDGDNEKFFKIFPQPPESLDIGSCRLLPFVDPEKEVHNAKRTKKEIERMSYLASQWQGPVISLQHVPLFDKKISDCPYNYVNADEILEAMQLSGVTHSISGHYHLGFQNITESGISTIINPLFCKKPFNFLEVNIDKNGKTLVKTHELALDKSLELCDYHIHTKFAYCNGNMDFEKVVKLQEVFNLKNIAFSEHTSHLYMNRDEYVNFNKTGVNRSISKPRVTEFLDTANKYRDTNIALGFEVDCDASGSPVLKNKDVDKVDIITGAMHYMPKDTRQNNSFTSSCFKQVLERFVKQLPMDILAHPFRLFKRANLPDPEDLFPFVVKLLKDNNIAAEINFHTNEPPKKFIQMCIEENVKLTLGSDSHILYKVGDFYPHLELLKSLGVNNSSIKQLLWNYSCKK